MYFSGRRLLTENSSGSKTGLKIVGMAIVVCLLLLKEVSSQTTRDCRPTNFLCLNGGTVTTTNGGPCMCECRDGFRGERCEISTAVDRLDESSQTERECRPLFHRCLNGGRGVSINGGFCLCRCTGIYIGYECEIRIDRTSDDQLETIAQARRMLESRQCFPRNFRCMHGGTKRPDFRRNCICDCLDQFRGHQCEISRFMTQDDLISE